MTIKEEFAGIQEWRAGDHHTGISNTMGIPGTYEHVTAYPTVAKSAVYRIEGYVPFAEPTPMHRNVYYVPGDELEEFFRVWAETAEVIYDVRPVTRLAALKELKSFRIKAGESK